MSLPGQRPSPLLPSSTLPALGTQGRREGLAAPYEVAPPPQDSPQRLCPTTRRTLSFHRAATGLPEPSLCPLCTASELPSFPPPLYGAPGAAPGRLLFSRTSCRRCPPSGTVLAGQAFLLGARLHLPSAMCWGQQGHRPLAAGRTGKAVLGLKGAPDHYHPPPTTHHAATLRFFENR